MLQLFGKVKSVKNNAQYAMGKKKPTKILKTLVGFSTKNLSISYHNVVSGAIF